MLEGDEADTFVFLDGDGNDHIADFDIGKNVVRFRGEGTPEGFDDLACEQIDPDPDWPTFTSTLVTWGNGENTILIQDPLFGQAEVSAIPPQDIVHAGEPQTNANQQRGHLPGWPCACSAAPLYPGFSHLPCPNRQAIPNHNTTAAQTASIWRNFAPLQDTKLKPGKAGGAAGGAHQLSGVALVALNLVLLVLGHRVLARLPLPHARGGINPGTDAAINKTANQAADHHGNNLVHLAALPICVHTQYKGNCYSNSANRAIMP
ncbi:MAG: hypothetical protein GDA52_04105 [Rhodobacteraceae bacterium]|nr:hypothetical protein [Paracoccaceae bacterium]